jgi:hypothetical protein
MITEEHPGSVTIVDLARGETREKPVAEVPEEMRFVYLRDGIAVTDPSQATERVPVVLVERMAFDEHGGPAADPAAAPSVVITEYGPGRRKLRTTHMVPNR